MYAGLARIDITPDRPVFMDGMIRAHKSTGTHDRLFTKALVLAGDTNPTNAFAIVSVDVAALAAQDALLAREQACRQTGIPIEHMIIAATHTHSGPATIGFFDPREEQYVQDLVRQISAVIERAHATVRPALIGIESGSESTISHYRRLLADDGHVVMNWENFPSDRIIGPLGVIDPEVGVVKICDAADPGKVIGLLFNHAGHPNVLSGDNYLISSDYPGLTENILEKKFGATSIFINGAQGTMDIDGLKDRDWAGRERVAEALADAVAQTAAGIAPSAGRLRGRAVRYHVPPRQISDQALAWSENILKQSGGKLKPAADGVGDDYKAALYKRLRTEQDQPREVEQICLAINDCALISFPGELFTEIGQRIKAKSPFRHTYILGLANAYIGYLPTREAIKQGGYEPDTRMLDDSAGDIVVEQSFQLLQRVYRATA